MLMIYAGASLAIWMMYRVVGGAIDRVKLNEFDRQMGALVGFAKGVLLVHRDHVFRGDAAGPGPAAADHRQPVAGSTSCRFWTRPTRWRRRRFTR